MKLNANPLLATLECSSSMTHSMQISSGSQKPQKSQHLQQNSIMQECRILVSSTILHKGFGRIQLDDQMLGIASRNHRTHSSLEFQQDADYIPQEGHSVALLVQARRRTGR